MKPFNLEEAKAGKPVVTADRLPVRILCYDRHSVSHPIVAIVESNEPNHEVVYYQLNGVHNNLWPNYNLHMATEKKTGWVNMYHCFYKIYPRRECDSVFSTEEEAKAYVVDKKNYITTIKIEWEE